MSRQVQSSIETYIIICAGGSGTRFGADMPKQYCDLAGRPVLMHAIDAMRRACPDAHLVLVLSAAMRELWTQLCERHGFESPVIVDGGETRWHSVANALRHIEGGAASGARVLIHDGARPLVDADVIGGVTAALDAGHTGAVPAIAVTDTLVATDDGLAFEAVPRSRYRAVQTPQGFALGPLSEAYRTLGYRADFTDDASVLRAAGVDDIVLTAGSPDNIKITNPRDIDIAAIIMQCRSN